MTIYERISIATLKPVTSEDSKVLDMKGKPTVGKQELYMSNKLSCSTAAPGRKLMCHVSPGAELPTSFIGCFPNRDFNTLLGYTTFMDKFLWLQI